jgi:hypothetical protein
MTDKQNYETVKPKLLLIPKEDIKEPNLPVNIAIGEAMDLHNYASTDREILETCDLDLNLIDDLEIRASALRAAQVNWVQVRKESTEIEEKWRKLSKEAFELRDELLHFCRYAYRNDKSAMHIVYHVAEGFTNTDMVQDLSHMAGLIVLKPDAFTAVGGDVEKATRAQTLAEECGAMLGSVNNDKANADKHSKDMRDRAFTYLKEAMDAIRNAGRFVFYKDADKEALYASPYFRKIRERNQSKEK